MTARFFSNSKPFAYARGSDQSHDRGGAHSAIRTLSDTFVTYLFIHLLIRVRGRYSDFSAGSINRNR
jgi:hypothetical protein